MLLMFLLGEGSRARGERVCGGYHIGRFVELVRCFFGANWERKQIKLKKKFTTIMNKQRPSSLRVATVSRGESANARERPITRTTFEQTGMSVVVSFPFLFLFEHLVPHSF